MISKFFNSLKLIHLVALALAAFSVKFLIFGATPSGAAVLMALAAVIGMYLYLNFKDEKRQEKLEERLETLTAEFETRMEAATKDLVQMNSRLNLISSEINIRKERDHAALAQIAKRKF